MDTKQGTKPRLFATPTAYWVAFLAYFITAALTFRGYSRIRRTEYGAIKHPSIIKIIVALVCIAVFMSMLKQTKSISEKFVLILSAIFFALWGTEALAGYGYALLPTPEIVLVSLILSVVATLLIGLRLTQIRR